MTWMLTSLPPGLIPRRAPCLVPCGLTIVHTVAVRSNELEQEHVVRALRQCNWVVGSVRRATARLAPRERRLPTRCRGSRSLAPRGRRSGVGMIGHSWLRLSERKKLGHPHCVTAEPRRRRLPERCRPFAKQAVAGRRAGSKPRRPISVTTIVPIPSRCWQECA